LGPEQLRNSGFREVHALTELESNVDTCIAEAGPLLERLGRRIGEQLAALAPATNADTKEAIHA
jgi:glycerate kinase